jgi:hypothetical protein
MALDWSENELHSVSTYYSKMMALFQLATDPVTKEIDGEIYPCLLASKASQSDNPTYEEAMNGLTLAPSIRAHGRHSTSFRTVVHEDNQGALSLANLEPGRGTPRSKHYAVTLHWFRSKLNPDGPHPIKVVKITADMQRADILTKGLSKVKFQAIRKLLCGW